jgi:sortase A
MLPAIFCPGIQTGLPPATKTRTGQEKRRWLYYAFRRLTSWCRVLDGTDALTLNHAAGRIEGTALPGRPGNIGIAAHRDSFFRNLGKLRSGDLIELETAAGTTTYVVDRTQIVEPTNVAVLDPRPASSITLVTCYPFGYLGKAPQRYIVTASLAHPDHGQASADRPAAR